MFFLTHLVLGTINIDTMLRFPSHKHTGRSKKLGIYPVQTFAKFRTTFLQICRKLYCLEEYQNSMVAETWGVLRIRDEHEKSSSWPRFRPPPVPQLVVNSKWAGWPAPIMLRTFKNAFQINWPRRSKRRLTTYESNSAFTLVDRRTND